MTLKAVLAISEWVKVTQNEILRFARRIGKDFACFLFIFLIFFGGGGKGKG